MAKWAFVSDFDGTISKKDFYWFIIENYFPEGRALYKEWKSEKLRDIEFLSKVFKSINKEEAQIIEDIKALPIDPHVPDFIKAVQQNGGDFFILSAGTDYYINHLLRHYGINDVEVFSNTGYFKDNNVHLSIDSTHRHFSKRYGIDKSLVIKELKERYEVVYFAGDSEPDSHGAKEADLTFAKDVLQDILKDFNVAYIPVDSFIDIEDELKSRSVLK
ncbi:MtnX-like HAD-IB family phosphatase [Alkalihalobacillus sp. CinArs1]|uniref:MtnX-like HAD-IB family phosphatase n=1 Tax=Alkalihalobacillus sp. CinArs1 TaxID=2995314 RepID=UPI0022DE13C4|nr:MtnX-like HAD-IB family phosphatase [Alkalihalobacillus sp. CinArs1]